MGICQRTLKEGLPMKGNRMKRRCITLLRGALLSILVSATQTPMAWSQPEAPARQGGQPAPALTQGDVEAWLDGLLPYAIQQGDIAGGVVSIVKDGQLLLAKGYGYADMDSRTPMAADTTLIRPGSISKLFVWTAVMQLVEQRRLDLDADINRYLDFHIPDYDGHPITMRNIVTHRSGFEDVLKDIMGRYPPQNLEHYVKTRLPPRIYAPGAVPAYSNYATALAAYVVERISGQGFAAYAAQHILRPLGMDRSTFDQPVPEAWRPNLSQGYITASAAPGYYEYVGPSPAGALTSTATDLAKFMLAHLQLGRLADGRILTEESASAMHALQPKVFPALNGMATGFYETTRNGHRSIAHNGGTQFFHSDLHLLLDDGVGIFISLNSAGNDGAATTIHNALFNGFMDRYFPPAPMAPAYGPAVADAPPATVRDDAKALSGYWGLSERHTASWLSVADLLAPVAIHDNGDGSVSFPIPTRGTVRWREIAPNLWRSDDMRDRMQVMPQEGRPALLGFDVAAPIAFLPVPWWRSPGWIVPGLVGALAVLLLHGLALPAGALARRVYGLEKKPGAQWLDHRVPKLLSLALVAALAGYPLLLSVLSADFTYASARTDGITYVLEGVTLLLLCGATGLAMLSTMAQWRRHSRAWRKAGALAVLAALAQVWWVAIAFRLINFNLQY
ncbi:Beta-lactamase [Nitrospirillum viridazoti Y2]|nr:Beta-lactamase [Nitrospirillum amazonense Y2]